MNRRTRFLPAVPARTSVEHIHQGQVETLRKEEEKKKKELRKNTEKEEKKRHRNGAEG